MVDKVMELSKKRVLLEIESLEGEFKRFVEKHNLPKKDAEELFYKIFKMGMTIEAYKSVFSNMVLLDKIKRLKKDDVTKL